ncbi:MAG: 50S ribosomal protein L29 [Saprospiraceae bacterium]|jgi:large subunit ribosomal protein L29
MAQQKLELADKSVEMLQEELGVMEKELQEMQFDHAVKGLGNPMELRALRRNIARVHTAIRALELETLSPEELELRSKKRARRRNQK